MGQPPNQRADYHFLYLAPGVSIDYFFVAARRYWKMFQPMVIHDPVVIGLVPADFTVALTTLARSDTVTMVRDLIQNTYGGRVYHDVLVYDFLEDAQLTLDFRAERNEPFGVPLIE